MGDSTASNGNGGQVSAAVLQAVLDKFLVLTEQNSTASSGMANAIESMGANISEMTEHLNALEAQIAEEPLGSVLSDAVVKIKASIAELKANMEACSLNRLAFLVDMCKHLTYQGQDPKKVADSMIKLIADECEYQDDLKWVMSGVTWIREHFYQICFLVGGLAIWMYLKAGVDTVGYIRAWFGH